MVPVHCVPCLLLCNQSHSQAHWSSWTVVSMHPDSFSKRTHLHSAHQAAGGPSQIASGVCVLGWWSSVLAKKSCSVVVCRFEITKWPVFFLNDLPLGNKNFTAIHENDSQAHTPWKLRPIRNMRIKQVTFPFAANFCLTYKVVPCVARQIGLQVGKVRDGYSSSSSNSWPGLYRLIWIPSTLHSLPHS